MAKIDTTIISQVLQEHANIDATQIASIIEQMKVASEEQANADRETNTSNKYKKKLIAIQARPYILHQDMQVDELTTFILKVPEVMTDEEVIRAISTVAFNFNEQQRNEARKVRNIGEALTYIKPKYFKPAFIQILTKEEIAITPLNPITGEFTVPLDLEEFGARLFVNNTPAQQETTQAAE